MELFFRKLSFCCLILAILMQPVCSQENVFILIDVSGNPLNAPTETKITPFLRDNAIDLVEGIIRGSNLGQIFPDWEKKNLSGFVSQTYKGKGKNIISLGSLIAVFPFGDRLTYENFQLFRATSGNSVLSDAMDFAHDFDYNDQHTFGELAIAMASHVAFREGINEYIMIRISGLGGDQTGSQPLTNEEKSYLDDFESAAEITPLGSFRYADMDKEFAVSVKRLNISKLANMTSTQSGQLPSPTPSPTPSQSERPRLSIVSPKGSKTSPLVLKNQDGVRVSWRCINCPDKTQFRVIVENLQTDKKDSKLVTNRTSTSFILASGKYQVQVTASGINPPQTQYFNVKSSGSGAGFFIFLLVLGLLVGGFLLLKKNDPFHWWDKKPSRQPGDITDQQQHLSSPTNSDDNDSIYF